MKLALGVAFALAMAFAMAACLDLDAEPAHAEERPLVERPFTHEAYVWQRAWTPAVVDAVRVRGPSFAALRVWAAEIDGDGRVAHAAPPPGALTGPVVLVVRIEGSVPVEGAQLAPVLRDVLAAFEGSDVRGVEIDHDCATARLSAYAALLADVRAVLDAHAAWEASRAALSITALPAWSAAPALDDVLAAVDHVVLQVHAVDAPRQGDARVFANQRARGFVDAFAPRAAKAGVAWRVALPAYGSRLSFDDGGRVVAVDSEAPRRLATRAPRTDVASEVWAEPAEVASLLRSLEVKRPRGLAGVVWFRLPVDGDRRAWSFATLEAVRAGHDLAPRVNVVVRSSGASAASGASGASDASDGRDGLRDVVVVNHGAVDAHAPHRVELDVVGLVAADGVNGFSFDHGFSSLRPPRIAPGGELVVGWVRAQEVTAHAAR